MSVLTSLLLKMNVAFVQLVDYLINFHVITDNLLDKNVSRNREDAQFLELRRVSNSPAALGVRIRVHLGSDRKPVCFVAVGGQRTKELAHWHRLVVQLGNQ